MSLPPQLFLKDALATLSAATEGGGCSLCNAPSNLPVLPVLPVLVVSHWPDLCISSLQRGQLQRLKDALATHSTDRCSLGPPAGPEQVLHPDLVPEAASGPTPPVTR